MKDINDLRRIRAEASAALTAAAEAIEALDAQETAAEEADVTAAEAAFDAAQAAFEKADKDVKRAETVEAANLAAATSEADTPAPGSVLHPAAAADPKHKGIEIGFMMHALTNARGDRTRASELLDEAGHSGVSAALSGASESAGGVLIPQAQSETIIDLLRPRVTVRNAGARSVPMPAGEIRDGKMTGSATASYGVENGAAVESEPTFGNVDKSFKTLKALVPVGNALLRHSTAAVAMMVRDDMLSVMGTREDLAFLRDDGTNNTPYGLNYWTPVANWQDAVASDAATVEVALRRCKSVVEDANVMMLSPGWIMRAACKNFLADLRDANGNKIFPSIDINGQLMGYPIQTTSQIPDNLGVGGDETEVYFGDFNEVMIGDAMMVTIATSTEAAYVNQAGDTVSAFQNDQTLMRAISEHDLAPNHVEALSGLNGVGWTL